MAKAKEDSCGRCDRRQECPHTETTYNSDGCGYKWFRKVTDRGDGIINYLKDEFFEQSKNRTGPGGRIAFDEPIKKLIKDCKEKQIIKDFPDLKECKNKLTDIIQIGDKQVEYQLKYDGAFYFGNEEKYIFYEVKGYGKESNSILSATMAAQFIKCGTRYGGNRSRYYYIGFGWAKSSGPTEEPITRTVYDSSKMITPYIQWAEHHRFIRGFYGPGDLTEMLNDIKRYCSEP